MEQRRFNLVIFDCDGVLVDSEVISNRVFVTMLNEMNISVTLEAQIKSSVLPRTQLFSGVSRCMALIALFKVR